MTLKEIKELLEKTGLPVAYRKFKKPASLPFICYLETGSHNFSADGKVYSEVKRIDIELYTENKEPETEEKLNQVLDGAGAFYERYEDYIDSEKMYQITYEIEV